MLDFVQRTGETVVVPAGWWRAAVNVSSSVAVAEDFVQAAALQAAVDGVASHGPSSQLRSRSVRPIRYYVHKV